jgi:hypothetical protein
VRECFKSGEVSTLEGMASTSGEVDVSEQCENDLLGHLPNLRDTGDGRVDKSLYVNDVSEICDQIVSDQAPKGRLRESNMSGEVSTPRVMPIDPGEVTVFDVRDNVSENAEKTGHMYARQCFVMSADSAFCRKC